MRSSRCPRNRRQYSLPGWLQRGELPRGEASRISGLKKRSARELLGALIQDGVLASDTPKGPVSLRLSLDAIEILFSSLFPKT